MTSEGAWAKGAGEAGGGLEDTSFHQADDATECSTVLYTVYVS